MIEMKEWDGFEGRLWKEEINVRQFIQDNYTPYDGDDSFLKGPTDATKKLWAQVMELSKEEREKGKEKLLRTNCYNTCCCTRSCNWNNNRSGIRRNYTRSHCSNNSSSGYIRIIASFNSNFNDML